MCGYFRCFVAKLGKKFSFFVAKLGFFLFLFLVDVEVIGADDEVAKKLGFEKVSEEFIEECKSRAVLYKHKKTGAEIMSVSNNDENKVFGIVFRTPP